MLPSFKVFFVAMNQFSGIANRVKKAQKVIETTIDKKYIYIFISEVDRILHD